MIDNPDIGKTEDDDGKIVNLIEKITEFMAGETQNLKRKTYPNLSENSAVKSRMLHDLNLAIRKLDPSSRSPAISGKVDQMKKEIGENLQCCNASAEAVREVIDIILSSAVENDRDGTYHLGSFQ
jgi:hypothetical protein